MSRLPLNDRVSAPGNEANFGAKSRLGGRAVLGQINVDSNVPSVATSTFGSKSNLSEMSYAKRAGLKSQGFSIYQDVTSSHEQVLMPPAAFRKIPPSASAPSFSIYRDENTPPADENTPPDDGGDENAAREAFWADKIAKLPNVRRQASSEEEEEDDCGMEAVPKHFRKPLRSLPVIQPTMIDPRLIHRQDDDDEDENDNSFQSDSSDIQAVPTSAPSSSATSALKAYNIADNDDEEEVETMEADCDEESMDNGREANVEEAPLSEEMEHMLQSREYHSEILAYLYSIEEKFEPKYNYMSKQPDISYGMRQILVDWLVEVGEEYKLNQETIYLAVNYVDRFLSFMSVQRAKLQLVGTACMFIAAKYEEIYPPELSEFVYITDDTYNKKQVLRMEQLVLKVLSFDLAVPTILLYTNKFASMLDCNEQTTFYAQYVSELTLMDGQTFIHTRSSLIGAACVALARHQTTEEQPWPEAMTSATGFSIVELRDVLISLHETVKAAPELSQQAIREKYKHSRFLGVSNLEARPIF